MVITEAEDKDSLLLHIEKALKRQNYEQTGTGEDSIIYANKRGINRLLKREIKLIPGSAGISLFGKRSDLFKLEEDLK
jgi:hypothetical protein